MKSNLIKIGLVCAVSALVFTACVKKEEPQTENTQTEQTTDTPVVIEPIEEVPAPEAIVLTEETSEETPNLSISETITTPTVSREQTAVVTEPAPAPRATPAAQPATQTQAAAPAVAPSASSNEAATVDDAVAAAMRAAAPALEQ